MTEDINELLSRIKQRCEDYENRHRDDDKGMDTHTEIEKLKIDMNIQNTLHNIADAQRLIDNLITRREIDRVKERISICEKEIG